MDNTCAMCAGVKAAIQIAVRASPVPPTSWATGLNSVSPRRPKTISVSVTGTAGTGAPTAPWWSVMALLFSPFWGLWPEKPMPSPFDRPRGRDEGSPLHVPKMPAAREVSGAAYPRVGLHCTTLPISTQAMVSPLSRPSPTTTISLQSAPAAATQSPFPLSRVHVRFCGAGRGCAGDGGCMYSWCTAGCRAGGIGWDELWP